MILSLLNVLPSLSTGLAMLIVGTHFRKHIHTEIGKNGICIPSAAKNEYKWLYAQAMGPRILISLGATAILVSFFVGCILVLLDGGDNLILMVNTGVGISVLVGALLYLDRKVDNFTPVWLNEEANDKGEMWLNTMKDYAAKNQFVLFERLAQSEE